jgi:phenylpyruvate tautomerase PptA (4-oxalocrotonate tautomerase family)
LTSAQKEAIAKSISYHHSEATGARPFFVQVVVEEGGGFAHEFCETNHG